MTNLTKLKAAEIAAREEYDKWCILNTWGKSPEELVEIDLGYNRAQRRWIAAHAAYTTALERAINQGVANG